MLYLGPQVNVFWNTPRHPLTSFFETFYLKNTIKKTPKRLIQHKKDNQASCLSAAAVLKISNGTEKHFVLFLGLHFAAKDPYRVQLGKLFHAAEAWMNILYLY